MPMLAVKQTELPTEAPQHELSPLQRTEEFLAVLTRLSIEHGIAIGGQPVLFLMEREDYDSGYRIDAESNLSFG